MNRLLLSAVTLAATFALGTASAAPVKVECATKLAGKVRVNCAHPNGFAFSLKPVSNDGKIEILSLVVERETAGTLPAFSIALEVPRTKLHHVWHPSDERFKTGWTVQKSSVTMELPVRTMFDDDERNVLTLSLSDALHEIEFNSDISYRDDNAHGISQAIYFFAAPPDKTARYETKIRFDARPVFWSDAVADASRWISATAGLRYPAPPASAYDPLYSSWYVFRSGVTQAKMDIEIEKAAALGMKTVILDDGWQADRGAWTVDTKKFPDFRAHVEKAHRLGLKYLVWFAVPYVAESSPIREKFRGKFFSERPVFGDTYVLDPRYPEVRAHLAACLRRLMTDYGLDGFKLDFIDDFRTPADDPAAKKGFAGCDHRGVPEAAQQLLKELRETIVTVKPDALIEYRQHYHGPVARQYANMIRAWDCPGDFEANRMRTLALRAHAPESVIHSDMLMWNADDTAAEVKRQVWNVMFSTVQYSALLDGLRADHLAAIRETVDFLTKHSDTLLKGTIRPHRPELNYPWVEAESATERIVAVYDPDTVVKVAKGKKTFVVNATSASTLIVEVDGTPTRLAVAPSGILSL